MRKNTQSNATPKTKISTWLFKAPAKFAVATTLLSLLGLFGYSLIRKSGATWPMFAIIGLAAVVCAIWMLRRMPMRPLNRREFVAIDFGLSLVAIIMPVVLSVIAYMVIFPLIGILVSKQMATGLAIIAFVTAIVALFQIGLALANMNPLYFRARALGIPRWKIVLSMPFSMLTLPGYLMGDDKEPADSVHIGADWYVRFIDRITSHETYLWASLVTIFIATALVSGTWFIIPLLTIYILLYLIWRRVQGRDTMRKRIGGAYATVAVVMNIIYVATYVIFISTGVKNITGLHKNTQTDTVIVTADTTSQPAPEKTTDAEK